MTLIYETKYGIGDIVKVHRYNRDEFGEIDAVSVTMDEIKADVEYRLKHIGDYVSESEIIGKMVLEKQ